MEFCRAISILLNTMVGGYSHETLCGRCYRLRKTHLIAHIMVVILNNIFRWQTNHCRRSHVADFLIKSRNFERNEALKLAEEMDR